MLSPTNVLSLLDAHGIPYDRGLADRSAVEGLLKAVDPGAAILSADEADALGKGESIEFEESWAEGIRYLRLRGLYDGSRTQVTDCVRAWLGADGAGLILDLRGAGGDNLDAVEAIASMFAEPERELYEVRNGEGDIVRTGRAEGDPVPAPRMPVMLLVDGETRQCSEVLASVLRDCDGIMVLGARTKGDTALRERLPLDGDLYLYIATRWVVRGGKVPLAQGEGMTPDIVMDAPRDSASDGRSGVSLYRDKPLSEKTRLDRELLQRVAGDPELSRATDILLGLQALGGAWPLGEEQSDVEPVSTNTTSVVDGGDDSPP